MRMLPEVLFAFGFAAIVGGAAWIFPPAGLLVGGVGLMGAGYLYAIERRKAAGGVSGPSDRNGGKHAPR